MSEPTRRAHVMLDLETWGKGDNAMIWQIGAVKFDPLAGNGRVLERFQITIDPESAEHYGKLDAGTIKWWMQDELRDARRQIFAQPIVDIGTALEGFSMWFGDISLPVWGNGATFDNVILTNGYKKLGLDRPWKFWDDRCFRTLKNLAPSVARQISNTAHVAVDDAEAQAIWMQRIVKHLGLKEID